jgi:hypothetical protein
MAPVTAPWQDWSPRSRSPADATWHVLSTDETYRDLGPDSFTNCDPNAKANASSTAGTPRILRRAHRAGRSSLNELFLPGTMEGTRERRCCLSPEVGIETVGTDAGAAPPSTCRSQCTASCSARGRYGLTQLANLAQLPPTGAGVVVAPLKLVRGTRNLARVLALAPRG